jgi:uncharacterized YccA/Bax inhibitor family protein
MTGNPALNKNTFTNAPAATGSGTMTIQGTVDKSAILLVLLTLAAAYTWHAASGAVNTYQGLMIGGVIGGLVVGFVTIFKKEWAPVTSPIYAICEGLFIGGFSWFLNQQWNGIVLQAVMLTLGTLAALLGAYKLRLISATDNFKRGVIAATGGIALLYLVTIIFSLFHVQLFATTIFGNGPIGIIFSLVVVVIAAMNLVLDFDFIEQGVAAGAPKYMEWYAAFGLLVTLVWLYLEILRLLAKLNSRR